MANTELLIRLRDLNDELDSINDNLKSAEHVADETIDELGQLVTDASDLIDQTNDSGIGESIARNELLDRINQFECDHERVTGFLTQLIEMMEMIEI